MDNNLSSSVFSTRIKENEHYEKYTENYTAEEYASTLQNNEL